MSCIEKRQRKRGKSYRVKVRLKGVSKSATFPKKDDAERWASKTETMIREGHFFRTEEAKRHTLAELIERYISGALASKRDKAQRAVQLRWWKSKLGDHPLAYVTPALIAEQRDKLLHQPLANGAARTPATVNRYLAALSAMFTVAVKEYGWTEDNPVTRVLRGKESRGRIRFLSNEERERLLTFCREKNPHDLYHAVMLALATGARKMEILGLRWNEVDLKRGVITLLETKNGEIRVLPIGDHVKSILHDRFNARNLNSPLVFPGKNPNRPIDLRTSWNFALMMTKIDDFRWHDLRHSTASYLAMNGATIQEIADVLGHKTLSMVKRYSHLSEQHTTGVINRMNNAIFGKMDSPQPPSDSVNAPLTPR
ncbi:MAG: site-specific integrase [Candidatus Contendobacter sp.]|nr:MAG: site-specific integrase [Candidatus Contendobacter sp.]